MFPVKKITVLCRGRGAAKFVKAISMCHNVYLTESRDGGKALQLWRSPRVLRGMGSIDLVAVFPWKKKKKKENELCYQAINGADRGRAHKVSPHCWLFCRGEVRVLLSEVHFQVKSFEDVVVTLKGTNFNSFLNISYFCLRQITFLAVLFASGR